jgi:hypothetical protein
MIEFVCTIPGADASTAAWHAAVHLGLTGFVTSAGSIFLALGIRAYRRSAPVVARAPAESTAVEPVDEVVVGGAGKALTLLERVSPWLVDRLALIGGLGVEAQRSDRPAAPRDNLFEPLDEPGAIHGEWESISRDRSWYTRTIGLHRTAARAVGLAAAAGIGVLVARRS